MPMPDARSNANDVRVTASRNEDIVQRPSFDGSFAPMNFQIKSSPVADNKLGFQHAPNFLTNSITRNRRNKPQISDVNPENWQAGATKPVSRLQQGSVSSNRNHQVCRAVMQITPASLRMLLRW